MELNESLWTKHQYDILDSFIYNIAYWKCSREAYCKLHGIRSELWLRTIDNYLLRGITDWCMIFGVDSNEIHWKRVVPDAIGQKEFRGKLLSALRLDRTAWDKYWSQMTTFRNDYTAHRQIKPAHPTVPYMEHALQAAILYDEWIREKLNELNVVMFDEPKLKDRYDWLMRTSKEPFTKMIPEGLDVNWFT
ncbi:hypothetical protein [Desulfogranum marinum]|uniref:hypothetical protein n=1 Tax=Desulfogranum marinum TaxID=453220 RepID=UPI0029C6AF71|nr:hypothetical protein [Desulfogranum marinum]